MANKPYWFYHTPALENYPYEKFVIFFAGLIFALIVWKLNKICKDWSRETANFQWGPESTNYARAIATMEEGPKESKEGLLYKPD